MHCNCPQAECGICAPAQDTSVAEAGLIKRWQISKWQPNWPGHCLMGSTQQCIHAGVRGGRGGVQVPHLGCLAERGGRDSVISILAVAQHHHR